MMFRQAVFALLSSVVMADVNLTPSGDVLANSDLGARLLSKATVVEHARQLDQNERDVTFVANYSIRYLGCSSLVQVAQEGGEEGGMLYTQHLVRFALCPTDACNSCSGGGEYVMSMDEFVDAYTEAKLNEKEYDCEMIRESCYCDNDNDDDVCEANCYKAAGRSDCIQYEGEEAFEIQPYLECAEMEGGNNNNNGGNYYQDGVYYGNFYIGPYCNPKDGKSIHLGVFYDEGCTAKGDDTLYAKQNYGIPLPYSTEPVVTSECMSCKEVDNDNNNNNNNGQQSAYYQEELEVNEFCQQAYEMAARCEDKMTITYTDTSGCDYINNILPRLEAASRSLGVGGSGGKAAKAFAVIFSFTTVLFGAYAYFLYRKIKRGSVDLSSQV